MISVRFTVSFNDTLDYLEVKEPILMTWPAHCVFTWNILMKSSFFN